MVGCRAAAPVLAAAGTGAYAVRALNVRMLVMTDRTLHMEVADIIATEVCKRELPHKIQDAWAATTILEAIGKRIAEHAGEWNGEVYAGVSNWPDGEAHGYGSGIDEVLELLGLDIPGTERMNALPEEE